MMNLSLYKVQHSYESFVTSKYQTNGIYKALGMDITDIANIFHGEISVTSGKSHVRWDDEHQFFVVFLNKDLSVEEKRYHFFHELSHPILHVDKQTRKMPKQFTALQEAQAKTFQLYASMPIYMLEDYQYVHSSCLVEVLCEDFYLPERLVRGRLDQINRYMNNTRFQQIIREREEKIYPKADPSKISVETQRIMDKLDHLLTKKKLRGVTSDG
jgi:Zn-dependent peptidase ImmA (M78 family)